MKFSYEDKSQAINEEINQQKLDPEEIYFRTEINFKSFNLFLHTNDELSDINAKNHVFTLTINEMNLNMDLLHYDVRMGISMSELKLYDIQNEMKDFQLMAYSGNESNKEVKLFDMEIILLEDKSPSYTNFQIGINMNIGYLHFTWVPDSIRNLLHFIIL